MEEKKSHYSDAARRATAKWRKENTKMISVLMVKNTPEDAEILAWLDTVPNKAAAIKAALLRAAREK